MDKSEKSRGRKRRGRGEAGPAALPQIRPHAAGIDLGSVEHWVCGPSSDGETANVRVFRTTTPALEELADWLAEQGVDTVAMESTHVYWIPLYELLDARGIEVRVPERGPLTAQGLHLRAPVVRLPGYGGVPGRGRVSALPRGLAAGPQRPRLLHRRRPRGGPLRHPRRRLHRLQRARQAGGKAVRQQAHRAPFPLAAETPNPRSRWLHPRIEPVRRQLARARPAPRAVRRGCEIPDPLANILLVGQACGKPHLQGRTDHGPAVETRGPPL